jgi:hypothetical protein
MNDHQKRPWYRPHRYELVAVALIVAILLALLIPAMKRTQHEPARSKATGTIAP